MKYIHYDKNNRKILGIYDKEIHVDIPNPFLKVTNVVWENIINNNHNKINEDGTTELFDFRSFDEQKKEKVDNINKKAYKEIISIYPEWKQSNIIRNKEASTEALAAYEEMTLFIDSIRAASDEEINNLPIGAE